MINIQSPYSCLFIKILFYNLNQLLCALISSIQLTVQTYHAIYLLQYQPVNNNIKVTY